MLARQHEDDGPHLIYVPEAPLTEEKFLADVDRVYKKLGRCLIAVTEGDQPSRRRSEGARRGPRRSSESLERGLPTATCSSPAPGRWATTSRT